MLVFGTRHKGEVAGYAPGRCRACGPTVLGVIQRTKKFTLYFIPVLTYGTESTAICARCGLEGSLPHGAKLVATLDVAVAALEAEHAPEIEVNSLDTPDDPLGLVSVEAVNSFFQASPIRVEQLPAITLRVSEAGFDALMASMFGTMSDLSEIRDRMTYEQAGYRYGAVTIPEALVLMNGLYLAARMDPTNAAALRADGDGVRSDLTVIVHDVMVMTGEMPGEPIYLKAA